MRPLPKRRLSVDDIDNPADDRITMTHVEERNTLWVEILDGTARARCEVNDEEALRIGRWLVSRFGGEEGGR